jgi:uncharacterized protein YjiS (DUF1127 family)
MSEVSGQSEQLCLLSYRCTISSFLARIRIFTLFEYGTKVMNTRQHHLPFWQGFTEVVREWRRRARSRAELRALDLTSGDYGISRDTAAWEASKPFWMA